VHRDAGEERPPGPLRELAGAGMLALEPLELALEEPPASLVDGPGHADGYFITGAKPRGAGRGR
jgi:hypothetical protein